MPRWSGPLLASNPESLKTQYLEGVSLIDTYLERSRRKATAVTLGPMPDSAFVIPADDRETIECLSRPRTPELLDEA